eukprot:scaffold26555_cov78-Attheya_sp.AAC.1
MTYDDINLSEHDDMLKIALKLSCISYANKDDQKYRYGIETVEICPSSDDKVMNVVDDEIESMYQMVRNIGYGMLSIIVVKRVVKRMPLNDWEGSYIMNKNWMWLLQQAMTPVSTVHVNNHHCQDCHHGKLTVLCAAADILTK